MAWQPFPGSAEEATPPTLTWVRPTSRPSAYSIDTPSFITGPFLRDRDGLL